MGNPSETAPALDISEAGFTAAARDVGEVVALLSGGVRPDPDTLSRLSLSMRCLQGFLIEEARQQGYREAITDDLALREATTTVVDRPPLDIVMPADDLLSVLRGDVRQSFRSMIEAGQLAAILDERAAS